VTDVTDVTNILDTIIMSCSGCGWGDYSTFQLLYTPSKKEPSQSHPSHITINNKMEKSFHYYLSMIHKMGIVGEGGFLFISLLDKYIAVL
jgi:hypothetical protein